MFLFEDDIEILYFKPDLSLELQAYSQLQPYTQHLRFSLSKMNCCSVCFSALPEILSPFSPPAFPITLYLYSFSDANQATSSVSSFSPFYIQFISKSCKLHLQTIFWIWLFLTSSAALIPAQLCILCLHQPPDDLPFIPSPWQAISPSMSPVILLLCFKIFNFLKKILKYLYCFIYLLSIFPHLFGCARS